MKCMANRKTYERAKNNLNNQNVRYVIRYMTAATAEIMLDKFHWSQCRLLEMLTSVWQNFNLTNTPLATVDSFNPEDNFGYKMQIKNSTIRKSSSVFSQCINQYKDQAIRWFIEVEVYTLKDEYNWSDSTTDRFVRYIDGYLAKLRDGTETVERMTEDLKERHKLDLRMHLI